VSTAIRIFRRAYPGVDVSLEESHTTRLLAGLAEGELDVVFLRPGAAEIEGLQVRLLSEEPLLAVVPSKHTAARQDKLKLAALRDEPFIMFPRVFHCTEPPRLKPAESNRPVTVDGIDQKPSENFFGSQTSSGVPAEPFGFLKATSTASATGIPSL
jgi:DNA-binding transcriptional LysR family regulator